MVSHGVNPLVTDQRVVVFTDTEVDAFGRQRVSQPFGLFDSKLLYNKQPLTWAEKITNASGLATSTHSAANTAVTMHVEAGDTIIRQSYQRIPYQPAKSQLVILTAVMGRRVQGVTKRLGQFDGNNGLFFQEDSGVVAVGKRKGGVDTVIPQSEWNLDRLDGSGPSGIILDSTRAQIFVIDFQWLGVGRVRWGFAIDRGMTVYCHEIDHANDVTSVYMSGPNLPVRYEISSNANGGAGDLDQICVAISSEGGRQDTEFTFTGSTGGTHVAASAADSVYAVIGLRLQADRLGTSIRPNRISMISEGAANDFEWMLYLDPTVAGAFTYADVTNSSAQIAKGATANTVTGGTLLIGGFASRSAQAVDEAFEENFHLGADVDGAVNAVVLCVRPLSNNQNIQAALSWKEVN